MALSRSILGKASLAGGAALVAFAQPARARNPTALVTPVQCDRACLTTLLAAVRDKMRADIRNWPRCAR